MKLKLLCLVVCISQVLLGHVYDPYRPDSHGPIGVMGEHTHLKGEIMYSVRAMRMSMDGLQQGSDSLSLSEYFAEGYMGAPTSMTMDMLMFGVMYGVSDDLTVMAMVPYVSKSMDTRNMAGTSTKTVSSSGVGDVAVSALLSVKKSRNVRAHLNFGVSLPAGSISETGDTLMGNDRRLAYPMQLGSGTTDFMPGFTIVQQDAWFVYGFQTKGVIHLGLNREGYRLGDRLDVTSWVSRLLSDHWSVSMRGTFTTAQAIYGQDDNLNASMMATADPDNFGGRSVDLGLGVNFDGDSRFAAEVGFPIYQDLTGIQMDPEWRATVGWQVVL